MAVMTKPNPSTDSVLGAGSVFETDAETVARWKAQDEIYAKHEAACETHNDWRRGACRCQIAAHDECARLGLVRS